MPVEQAISELRSEDLRNALRRIERANDMLPPREDDKIAGRIAARFVEGLRARIATGDYRCEGAYFVPVPKRRLTTRPAAVVTLRDRVVLEALVETVRTKITGYLVAPETVIWPRGDSTRPSWNAFERAPLDKGGGYIVSADVAGYYESVDHKRLRITLAEAGVGEATQRAIVYMLQELMGNDRGLPQGVASSDALATLYLAPVDSELQRRGQTFWRHGDDFRLWAPTYPEALRGIYELEQALRAHGLLLNTGKLKVHSFARYSAALNDLDKASEAFRSRILEARKQAVLEASEEELVALLEAAEVDEDMQWRFFYHGAADITDVWNSIAPSLAPGPIEVIEEMFSDLMNRDAGQALPSQLRHMRLTFCLRRLAQAKSPHALPWIGGLLVRQPDETQSLANYLLALSAREPDKVVAACQYALTQKAHLLDWERAWIYRVLSRSAHLVSATILMQARQVAESGSSNWIARVEALRLLARANSLTHTTASPVIRDAPECFRGDIAGIVAMIEEPGEWTARYLDGAQQDALERAVIDGVRAKRQQQHVSTTAPDTSPSS